jgi:hypothetical protein
VAFLRNIGLAEILCIGFVFFLLFSTLVVSVVIVVLRSGRRPCPRCGESVPKEARVCRFCGAALGS